MRNPPQHKRVGTNLKSHFFIETEGIALCLYLNAAGTQTLGQLDGLFHHLESVVLVAVGGENTANMSQFSVGIPEDP